MNSFAAVVLFYIEMVFALALLWKEGLLKTRRAQVTSLVLVVLVFFLRYLCMDYETDDYLNWISRWVQHFRDNGTWKGLGMEIWACNYNVPYLYFLAVFSKLGIYDLYTVKLLSILFDILLAYWLMKIVALFSESAGRRLTAFIGALWLPTVFLNGALWGQCDSMYAAFSVLSLYLVLSDRPIGGIIAFAVSFSLKLQAIFLMPIFLVFVLARKMKFWQLFVFPVAYVVTILPAVLAGRNFVDLLLLYYNNTGSIGEGLNYNSSSMYSLSEFPGLSTAAAGNVGIFLAFSLCIFLFAWTLLRRRHVDNSVLLGMAVVLCIGVPFFLPHMHDRYFFLADVLSFALAVAFPWESLIPALVSFGSLLGYHAYLRLRYLLPMRYGGLAMLFALLLSIVFVAARLEKNKKIELTNPSNLL